MLDPRAGQLARVLCDYSCAVQSGEFVLIEAIDVPHEFSAALIEAVSARGGRPLLILKSNQINRALMQAGSLEQWDLIADIERQRMQRVQCYIGVRGNPNVSELSDVPADKQKLYESTVWKRVHHEVRIKQTRWVVLRWPSASMAQLAQVSTEAFEDFYFNVCTLDYARMGRAMRPMVDLMQHTDQVHLRGPGETDLRFSIKGIPAIACAGHMNIPDGEIFTAPVRDSINGVIQFNCPTLYRGTTHENVRLEFKDGRIVQASSTQSAKLNEVLNSDEGARYVGEFAIGVNPYCTRPMKDILFDEKIAGSIHLTPGSCYDEASNGNKSDIHWDLVLMQTPEAGGGQMYFDGRLVRDNGRFVLPELADLNPERLV